MDFNVLPFARGHPDELENINLRGKKRNNEIFFFNYEEKTGEQARRYTTKHSC